MRRGASGLWKPFVDFEIKNLTKQNSFIFPSSEGCDFYCLLFCITCLYFISLSLSLSFSLSTLLLSQSAAAFTHARACRACAHDPLRVHTRGTKGLLPLWDNVLSARARVRESCGKAFTRFDHVRRVRDRLGRDARGRNGHVKKRIAPPLSLI